VTQARRPTFPPGNRRFFPFSKHGRTAVEVLFFPVFFLACTSSLAISRAFGFPVPPWRIVLCLALLVCGALLYGFFTSPFSLNVTGLRYTRFFLYWAAPCFFFFNLPRARSFQVVYVYAVPSGAKRMNSSSFLHLSRNTLECPPFIPRTDCFPLSAGSF